MAALKRQQDNPKSRFDTVEKTVLLQRLAETAAEIERTKAEADRFKEEARRTARALARAGRAIRTLETRLQVVEGSTSFALGNSIIRSAKSPRQLLRLPSIMWELYRQSRYGRDSQTFMRRRDVAAPEADKLISLYRSGGCEPVIAAIRELHREDFSAASAALMQAAEALTYAGYPEAELQLIAEAVSLNRSESSLYALYWAANFDGNVQATWQSIRELKELYGDSPRPREQALLKKMERNPACQFSVLESVEAARLRVHAPVPNRLCYILHNSLPFSSGGYATRAHGMALGFTEAGIEVRCLTRPGYPLDTMVDLKGSSVAQSETIEGIEYQRILSPLRTDSSGLEYMLGAADELTAAFARLRPEWVMAASNYLTAMPALIASRRLGIPFFYEIRGFWEITRISREPEYIETMSYNVYETMEAEVAKRADHVFTLTNPMRDELVRRGVAAEKVTILPNSCSAERFTARPRDMQLAESLGIPARVPVIGYLGTFVQYEGLDDLVSAAALVKGRGKEFRLLLVGNENTSGQGRGPITEEIRRIARENDLESWLIMPGRVPHEQVESYYSLIDIAPFPRKPQPVTELVSPMKPLEALAMEKAVVVSSVAALAEMTKPGETGLVFRKGDVLDLANVLQRLIDDSDLRHTLGKNGRRWVEQERTWAQTAQTAKDKLVSVSTRNEVCFPVEI